MKKVFKHLGVVLGVIMILITMTFIGITIVSFTTKKPVKVFGYGYGVVGSGSMQPMILYGDFVLIKEIPFDELQIDDVIAFISGDGEYTVIHQIINRDEDELLTKGLFNPTDDLEDHGMITEDRVIGKVIAFGGKEIGSFILDSRATLITISIGMIAILFIIQLVGFFKQVKAKEKAKLDAELKAYSDKLKQELLDDDSKKDEKKND